MSWVLMSVSAVALVANIISANGPLWIGITAWALGYWMARTTEDL